MTKKYPPPTKIPFEWNGNPKGTPITNLPDDDLRAIIDWSRNAGKFLDVADVCESVLDGRQGAPAAAAPVQRGGYTPNAQPGAPAPWAGPGAPRGGSGQAPPPPPPQPAVPVLSAQTVAHFGLCLGAAVDLVRTLSTQVLTPQDDIAFSGDNICSIAASLFIQSNREAGL